MRSETPPPPANLKVLKSSAANDPTSAMLKGDIDSGRTGDKVTHYDAGLSPLGTDDEAAGNPVSTERVAQARKAEAASPQVRASADVHGGGRGARIAYVAGIVLIAVVLVGALWYVR